MPTDKRPKIHPTAYVHPRATVVGDVVLEEHASVWPGASLRGDLMQIRVGAFSNVQDNCVIHTTKGGSPSVLGRYVSIGHGAVVHSAAIEDDCLIGMSATILDDVVIGRGSLVAAGAVLAPGTKIPRNSLVMGVPAKVVKTDPALRARCHENAANYLEYQEWHRRGDFPPASGSTGVGKSL